jgi:hypothetical protein
MEDIETIFSSENEVVEKLKEFVQQLDYKKIFFEHLGPELTKIYLKKKDKVFIKNFLEASQYEYGFFGKKIDLSKAFSLYKKYADLNDYFCMYKMHVIYLCEYEKFSVPFSRALEKIYLLKCLAYLQNYIYDWNIKLFEKIDVLLEIAQSLDLEDNDLEKHQIFFDILYNQREKYNLTENDVNLMKGVLFCYFHKEDSDLHIISFCTLNSLIPKKDIDIDYAYYHAKNRSIFFTNYLKLEDTISDAEIEAFYKEIENKKLYEFYADYGNYLLNKKNNANEEIFNIFITGSKNGFIFCSFRAYQCLIDLYDFDQIMQDYNKATIILELLLDEVVFENIALKQFISLVGYLIKFSNFSEKIISKYLIYIKEINDYINRVLIRKEKEKEPIMKDEEYLYGIKAYMFYFGFKDIEKQNLQKSIEFIDKESKITDKCYIQKQNEFFKYNIKKELYNLKLISKDELLKAKKELIEIFYKNLYLKYQTMDCYVIGEDFFEGITKKKDEFVALEIYKCGQNIFCKTIFDCLIKSKIKKFLKNHDYKIENKLKDEICGICYDKKINKVFIPCKHNCCSSCFDKLEKDSKCPFCRGNILCII